MDLQVFSGKFGDVRTFNVDGEPWFVGADVAKILGYARPTDTVRQRCRYTIKRSVPHPQNIGRELLVLTIPESDLFRLVVGSKLDHAQDFEKWVFDVILPTIRKTGSYQAREATGNMSNELLLVESASKIMNINDASKLLMLQTVAKRNGINPAGILPDYTEEESTISLTTLLKKYNCNITATKANKILIEKGFVEIKERPSRKKNEVKRYKAFTERGLIFGKNLISPQNQRETQCHYFDKPDILEYLE